MNTFQLECFLSVANYLNFAKASNQMNISQPAMTHQIQTLENELHTKLFLRTTRSVKLTPEGLAFLDDAKKIIGISQSAINRFSIIDQYKPRVVSIGCTFYLNPYLFIESIRELHQLYPNFHPRLQQIQGSQLLNKLETGAIDIAMQIQSEETISQVIVYKELKKVSILCVGYKEFFDTTKEILTLDDLREAPLILCNPTSLSSDIASLQWELSRGKKTSDLYFCEDVESMLFLCEAGFGIALLPDIFIPAHNTSFHAIPVNVPKLSFGMYYRKDQKDDLIKNFRKIIIDKATPKNMH